MTLNPYLNFGGNCKEALTYYTQHLGGTVVTMMTFDQMPGGSPAPGGENLVLHARIVLGGLSVMASDVPPPMKWEPMRSAYLTLSVTSDEEAEKAHAALSDGGEIFMPMGETFYAFKFSMLRDKFGINWMVIYERPMPS